MNNTQFPAKAHRNYTVTPSPEITDIIPSSHFHDGGIFMGLGKWILGGIVTAVAAPFVLPAATVAAIGGAVTAGVGAVTAGAAAVGGAVATGAAAVGSAVAAGAGAVAAGAAAAGAAVAGLGASALAAASAIGATTLIGGITVANVLAWGGGLFVVAAISASMADEARTEGVKEGYSKASREYEAKLRAQAKEFLKQVAALKEEIESMRLQRDKAQALAKQAFTLLGKFEGCINATKEKGGNVEAETAGYYTQLKNFTEKSGLAKAA